MIEIKHRVTGAVLHTVDANTLEYADLRGADLIGANLYGAKVNAEQVDSIIKAIRIEVLP